MQKEQKTLLIVLLLSALVGGGAGVISSTITSRSMESYVTALLNDQRYLSLVPRKSPALPGTYEDSLKVNREDSLRILVTFLPHAEDGVSASEWIFPEDRLSLGVPVTSDGWVLTTSAAFGTKAALKDMDAYVQGKHYALEKVVRDPYTSLVLLKLKDASGLPTIGFGKPEDVVSGSMVFAWTGREQVLPTSLIAADAPLRYGAQEAETFTTTWEIANELSYGTPVFSPEGDLLGFADGGKTVTPLHHSGAFVQDVLKTGTPKLAKLGVWVLDLSRGYNVSAEISQGRTEGAVIVYPFGGIQAVAPNGPAGKAGLQALDIILDVDGRAVSHAETLAEILADYEPGEIANMHVLRDGVTKEFTVTLGEL